MSFSHFLRDLATPRSLNRIAKLLVALCVLTLLIMCVPPPQPARSQRGALNGLLARQGLSHTAFHCLTFKMRLAALVRRSALVVIAGVEWGDDALALVDAGYSVVGFEPHPMYFERVYRRRRHNFTLHNIAAGATTGNVTLSYKGLETLVKMAPIRHFIRSEVDVLSADVQGNELDVLRGAQGVPIRSMWIEIFPCNPKVPHIFRLLDQHYVLFDFVPWGLFKDVEANHKLPRSLAELNLAQWNRRPSEFESYLEWFCTTRVSLFSWLQTDILAVRRDLLPPIIDSLATIANDVLVSSQLVN